jgi:hypothetical protein
MQLTTCFIDEMPSRRHISATVGFFYIFVGSTLAPVRGQGSFGGFTIVPRLLRIVKEREAVDQPVGGYPFPSDG